MNAQHLNKNEVEAVILALDECYRRLHAANVSARDLTQEGFSLMFKSAYQGIIQK
ncbi:hypothetical protein JCM19237_6165 [Photobacterium aphoticum]|uniref:Uncharacterized protein n=1 Tax=Photobacterium aphoticum TaxID=754436 RepID=A0A090R6K8_9GAMM|nr:hypothetical protein JCM19237_6165 [Photobacterium aphoticum]